MLRIETNDYRLRATAAQERALVLAVATVAHVLFKSRPAFVGALGVASAWSLYKSHQYKQASELASSRATLPRGVGVPVRFGVALGLYQTALAYTALNGSWSGRLRFATQGLLSTSFIATFVRHSNRIGPAHREIYRRRAEEREALRRAAEEEREALRRAAEEARLAPWNCLVEGGDTNAVRGLPDLVLKKSFSFLSPYQIRTITARLSKQCFKLSSELLVEELQRCHPLADPRFPQMLNLVVGGRRWHSPPVPALTLTTLWTDHLPGIRRNFARPPNHGDMVRDLPSHAHWLIGRRHTLRWLVEGDEIDASLMLVQRELAHTLLSWDPDVTELCFAGFAGLSEPDDFRTGCIELALHWGGNPERLGRDGHTAVLEAAYCCYPEALSQLRTASANMNATNANGQNALHLALSPLVYDYSEETKAKKREAVQFLLAAGTDVNRVDSCRETPLHYAAIKKDVRLVKLLVEAGANLNVLSDRGGSPLLYAVSYMGDDWAGDHREQIAIVDYLIEAGADPSSGASSLHCLGDDAWSFFPRNGYGDDHRKDLLYVIKRLVGAGADLKAIGEDGKTPYDLVKEYYTELEEDGGYIKDALDYKILAHLRTKNPSKASIKAAQFKVRASSALRRVLGKKRDALEED